MLSVSVVIPFYKNGDTIDRAVGSVLAQRRPARDITIIDDCSSEPLPPERFADAPVPVRVIRHQTNGGGAAARNTGIRHAKGDLIAFLDADDMWFEDKLATQVSTLEAAGDELAYSASNCMIGEFGGETALHNNAEPTKGERIAQYLLVEGNALQTSTLVVPTKLAQENPFRPDLKRHQDWDFVLKLEQAGAKLHYEPRPLSHYDLSPRNGRISRQKMGFKQTLKWLLSSQEMLTTSEIQHCFMQHGVSRRYASALPSLTGAFLKVFALDPARMTGIVARHYGKRLTVGAESGSAPR